MDKKASYKKGAYGGDELTDGVLDFLNQIETVNKFSEPPTNQIPLKNGNYTARLTKDLHDIENISKNLNRNIESYIRKEVETLNELNDKLSELHDDGMPPKLWIYGCSMSNKHELKDHTETWYTRLADKLEMDLKVRSHEGFGMNAIERTVFLDLPKIDFKKDLVIFSPSFWHRVFIMEFQAGKQGFYPNEKDFGWYKDMKDFDEIIQMNYERWINVCEIFLKLGIQFRTWLLDSPLVEEYPYTSAKRVAKFDHLILKPKLEPQILSWMAYQKQHPEYWWCSDSGKEDYHYNITGHNYICDEFYKQIVNKPSLI